MDRLELQAGLTEMRQSARDYVTAYARLHAPHVEAQFVDAVCRALGDISIDEAICAIDRLQVEA